MAKQINDNDKADRHHRITDIIRGHGREPAACRTCNTPCFPGGESPACPRCWEVEGRLESYLRDGEEQARIVLETAMAADRVRRTAAITKEMIAEMRQLTGGSARDCRQALIDNGGDVTRAAEAMKLKGET